VEAFQIDLPSQVTVGFEPLVIFVSFNRFISLSFRTDLDCRVLVPHYYSVRVLLSYSLRSQSLKAA